MKTIRIGIFAMIALVFCMISYLAIRLSHERFPFYATFEGSRPSHVTTLAGTWNAEGGIIRNSSDERGAKLVFGSKRWTDYTIDADVRILGNVGDAGLIVRSNDEEIGVDSYRGYYVGIRTIDNSVVLGRADFGWSEARPARVPMDVRQFQWIHLHAIVVGCDLLAQVSEVSSGKSEAISMRDAECFRSGRVGLRSVSTGAEWRSIVVSSVREEDVRALKNASGVPRTPRYPKEEAEYNQLSAFETVRRIPPTIQTPHLATVESIRGSFETHISLRGVVTMVRPKLFVQDATAGIEVQTSHSQVNTLSIGDQIEASGIARTHQNLGVPVAMLDEASTRVLWRRPPAAPIAVTALQATKGEFDSRLVEIQAEVSSIERGRNQDAIHLTDESQRFVAFLPKLSPDSQAPRLAPHSVVRVRGICVHDPKTTGKTDPFVLLLRSADDVREIAGAPWWATRNLIQLLLVVSVILITIQAYHARMRRKSDAAISGERERVAHELHDTLAQSFAGVAFQLQGIRNKVRSRDIVRLDSIEKQMDVAADFVRRTHQEASLSIARLKSSDSELNHLGASLERCVRDLTTPEIAKVRMVGNRDLAEVPLLVREALFHIGREAIVNAVRHSGSSNILITIDHTSTYLSLEILDEGRGFVRSDDSQRLGLVGMERRAAMARAKLLIESTVGVGTRIFVSVPISRRRWKVASVVGIFGARR